MILNGTSRENLNYSFLRVLRIAVVIDAWIWDHKHYIDLTASLVWFLNKIISHYGLNRITAILGRSCYTYAQILRTRLDPSNVKDGIISHHSADGRTLIPRSSTEWHSRYLVNCLKYSTCSRKIVYWLNLSYTQNISRKKGWKLVIKDLPLYSRTWTNWCNFHDFKISLVIGLFHILKRKTLEVSGRSEAAPLSHRNTHQLVLSYFMKF